MKYIVYKATNNINGKIYIGCTNQGLRRRINQHLNPNNKKTHFRFALSKYGIDNFTVEVIDTLNTNEEMFNREMYWISHFKSNDRKVGYNCTIGGDRGPVMIGKDNPNFGKPSSNPKWTEIGQRNKGKKLDPKIVAKIKESRRGHTRTIQYKQKMSESKKRYFSDNVRSEEWSKNISLGKIGKPSHKKILILCLNNYKVYDSYGHAAKALGVSQGNIPQVVSGKASHTKGFIFQKVTAEHLIF